MDKDRRRLMGILGLYTGHLIKHGIISNIPHKQLANATVAFMLQYSEEDFNRIVGEAEDKWDKGVPPPSEQEINEAIYVAQPIKDPNNPLDKLTEDAQKMGLYDVANNEQTGGPWTTEWQPMTTYYEKNWVDIITKDGEEISRCWPNAGFMNPRNHSRREIPYSEVDKVRLTHYPR